MLTAEVAVAAAELELVAKLAISLNQWFNRSGRTGSGFHMTCAGKGSFRNSSFFIITHTGLLIESGLGDLRENAGGHILHGLPLFMFWAGMLFMDQLIFGGYKGLLLYNKASSAANLDSSGCRKGWYKYGSGGNKDRDNFRCSESGFKIDGKPDEVDIGGMRLLCRL